MSRAKVACSGPIISRLAITCKKEKVSHNHRRDKKSFRANSSLTQHRHKARNYEPQDRIAGINDPSFKAEIKKADRCGEGDC